MSIRSLAGALIVVAGCGRPADAGDAGAAASAPVASPPASATAAPAPTIACATTAPAPADLALQGELPPAPACWTFDSAAAAFDAVLSTKPLVVAIGESHAQKGSETVKSVTVRFSDELLPRVAPNASDLVLELWVAAPKCDKKKVEAVAKKQEPVTQNQAAGNQSEFIALGDKAKSLKVRPHALVPTCDEYDTILKAGDDAVLTMLTMIGRTTSHDLATLVEANRKSGAERIVLAYGGAMHNDVAPAKGREAWSFGPDLIKVTAGRYVELDLVVPEFVRDTDAWRNLPWYPAYDPNAPAGKATLIRSRPGSFALVFPRSSS